MKRSILVSALILLALLITACGSAPAAAPAAPAVDNSQPAVAPAATDAVHPALTLDFEGALSQKLMLSLGTLELANTEYAVSVEQATQFLFYWQALENLTQSNNSAEEEVAALLTEIENIFTPEQITAINQMQLKQENLLAWAQANGVTAGTGAGAGAGQGQGQGNGMSPEARATRQAADGNTNAGAAGENGLSAAITNALIAYLQSVK